MAVLARPSRMASIRMRREFVVNLIETLSVGVYFLIFLVALISQFFQSEFINLSVYGPIYLFSALGLFVHTLSLLLPENLRLNSNWLLTTILTNLVVASGLIHYSGVNQSMFFFLYLLNIVAAGMLFQVRGTLLTAVSSSAIYNLIMILGPEIKAGTFLFLTALNNLAFFVVAALSGYLAEQMELLDEELQETGKRLSEYTQLASVIIDKVPVALVTVDSVGKVVRANEAANRFFEMDGLLNRKFKEIFPFENEGEFSWTRESEKQSELIVRRGKLEILGVENGSIFVIEDVTSQRQMEYRMRQQEKMAAVGQLAAGIAHEIRNPLAGISGSVQMLSLNASTDEDRKLFNIIIRETDRLNNLISEFLDYSRPENPPKDPVDIEALVKECLDLVGFNKKIRKDIKVHFTPIGNLKIRANKDKLKQAILNIIINGYQAMDKSERAELTILTQRENGKVFLSITDTGCGIPTKVKDRMFEPFLTTKVGGTGLGLAVTHKILESHKAEVEVESQEGLGTTFKLRFPEVLS